MQIMLYLHVQNVNPNNHAELARAPEDTILELDFRRGEANPVDVHGANMCKL